MDDTDELIIQLCTRIGMIMEDASPTALTIGRVGREERAVALGELELAAERIGALIRASRALLAEAS